MARQINGCWVRKGFADSPTILDPCNCSSYYHRVTDPFLSKVRHVCEGDRLWNYEQDKCMLAQLVIDNGVCEINAPWNRCENLTASAKEKMQSKCIEDGYFNTDITGMSSMFMFMVKLSRETQLANLHLAFAAMFAGCIITMMLLALLATFCNCHKLRRKLSYVPARPLKIKGVRPHDITEGDHVSVMYEDIDEIEEDITDINFQPNSTKVLRKQDSGKAQREKYKPQRPGVPGSNIFTKQTPVNRTSTEQTPAEISVEVASHSVPKAKQKAHLPASKSKGQKPQRPEPPKLSSRESASYIHPV